MTTNCGHHHLQLEAKHGYFYVSVQPERYYDRVNVRAHSLITFGFDGNNEEGQALVHLPQVKRSGTGLPVSNVDIAAKAAMRGCSGVMKRHYLYPTLPRRPSNCTKLQPLLTRENDYQVFFSHLRQCGRGSEGRKTFGSEPLTHLGFHCYRLQQTTRGQTLQGNDS